MPDKFVTQRRVEFRDTDAAGIMHFSSFFPMMEEVEHEFWRSLGLDIIAPDPAGAIVWPRVMARCDYRSPVTFGDVMDIELRVGRVGGKSVTYDFEFSHQGRPVATGQVVAVACRMTPGATPLSVAVPEKVARAFAAEGKKS